MAAGLICQAVLSGSAAAQPILQNGDFETGDFSGWTVGGNAGIAEVVDASVFTPSITPPSGNFMAIITNGPGAVDPVSQSNLDGDASATEDNDRSSLTQVFSLSASQTPARLLYDRIWLTAENNTNDEFDDFFIMTMNGIPMDSGSVDGKTLSPMVNNPTDGIPVTVTSGGPANGCSFAFGQSNVFSVEMSVPGPGIHTIEFVVADQGNGNFTNDSALIIDNLRVLPISDLRVSLASPPSGIAGTDAGSFEITVENVSGATATGVEVILDLPAPLTAIGLPAGCSSTGPNQTTCIIGDLAAGSTRTVSVLAHVEADAVVGAGGISQFTAVATVQSPGIDSDPSNNTASGQTLVTDRADLRVTKVRSPSTDICGCQPFTYTFFIENLGPSYARPDIALLDHIFSSSGLLTLDSFELDPNFNDSGPFSDPAPIGSQISRFVLNEALPSPGEPVTNRWVIQTTYIGADAQSITDIGSVPLSPGGTPDPDLTNNEAIDSLVVTQTADLKVTQFADAAGPVSAGEVIAYTLIVDNFGRATADGVVLNALVQSSGTFDLVDIISDRDASSVSLPPGGPAVPLTATPWPPPAPPPAFGVDPATGVADVDRRIEIEIQLTDPLLPIQAGGPPNVGRWIVTLRLRARETQSITSVADVLSDILDLDMSNNHAEAASSIAASADLAVTKAVGPDPFIAGEIVSWDITVTNNGPSIARGVVVNDELPDGIIVSSAVVNSPGTGSCALGIPGDPYHLVCGLGDLAAGAAVTITVEALIDPAYPDGLDLVNSALVSSDSFDPDNSNNLGTAAETVAAEAPLLVLLDALPDPVRAGENLGYAILVANSGPSVARDVQVFHLLPVETEVPSRIEVLGAPGAQAAFDPPTQTVVCRLGDLSVGQIVYVLVTARVRSNTLDGTTISSEVEAISGTFPGISGDLLDTDVVAECDASIVKAASTPTSPSGDRVTYNLTIVNSGPSDASSIRVYDVLPDGVRVLSNSASPACTQPDNLLAFRALLSGDEVVPAVATSARGHATLILNRNTFELVFAIRVTDIDNIVSAHVRSGDFGVNGPVVADLFTGGFPFSPTSALSGTVTLTAAQAADIEAAPGDFYIDVRTGDFAAGEIRAQLQAAGSGPLSCEIGTLGAGASQSISILTQLDPDIAPESLLENVGLITADSDSRVSNNVSAVTVLSDAVADLSVVKFSKPDTTVPAGAAFGYTILVRNNGPSFAYGVRIRDQAFSSGSFTIQAITDDPARNDSVGGIAGGAFECRLNTPLEPVGYGAGTGTWTIRVLVTAAQAQDINNLVRVFTSADANFPVASTDPDPSNNETIDFISVQDQADLSLGMNVDVGTVQAGGVITYTLAVTNNGPSQAINVVVRDVMPAGVSVQNVGSSLGGCALGFPGEAIAPAVCQLGSLAAGQSATIQLSVVAPLTGTSGPLVNFGSVLSDKIDPNNANNIASAVVHYIAPAPAPPAGQGTPPAGGCGACGAGTATAVPLIGLLGLGMGRRRRRPLR